MTDSEQLISTFRAAVAAVDPGRLVREAIQKLTNAQKSDLASAPRILVVGAGKAGGAMAGALESCFPDRVTGLVNVPGGTSQTTQHIKLHEARPAGWNHPTAEGVTGARQMLSLLQSAGPNDVAIALISGGGSALLPCPADGITLEEKQTITKALHASGATITEMNCVRKHLSAIKGGRLAQAFRGKRLISLVLSDVVGDPLDVIASGPTVPDPTTFVMAWAVLKKYGIVPSAGVADVLNRGLRGDIPETPKHLPANIETIVIGSNATALDAAKQQLDVTGFPILDLGPYIEGETKTVANVVADMVKSIRSRAKPLEAPSFIILGGETTVTLGQNPGTGGRNQEFVLAILDRLGPHGMAGVTVLSAGTDGEDGPTDAAGAIADADTWKRAESLSLAPADFLARHDAYSFFEKTGGLIKTGLTGTNVMDLRIVFVDKITN